jgi:hypothetical protein
VKVLISRRAEEDLAGIHAYIAARNPDAAERFRTEAEKALDLMVRACGPIPMVDFARAKARFMEENSLDDLLRQQ